MSSTYHPLLPRESPALLSVVIPIYNEQDMIPILRQAIGQWMDHLRTRRIETELILVNDGSADRSIDLLLTWAKEDDRVRIIALSRNFGHQAAITAGLDAMTGDAAIVMDADLQDPPAVAEQMIDKYMEGYDIVYGRRSRRQGESPAKKILAWGYYRLMRRLIHKDMPVDTGDFRLMSRRCVDAFNQLRETHRFVRGMVAWLGFPATSVVYERPARASGETKYPWRKSARLAWNGMVSFSPLPLRASLWLGVVVVILAMGMVLYSLLARFGCFNGVVPGWTSQIIIECLIGGAILISNGLIGEYIARIFEEGKSRPLYIVSHQTPARTHDKAPPIHDS